jgi:hypothetical protein
MSNLLVSGPPDPKTCKGCHRFEGSASGAAHCREFGDRWYLGIDLEEDPPRYPERSEKCLASETDANNMVLLGHKEHCYYCGEECSVLAANPSKWPIALPHKEEPGVVKWHHAGCVMKRLKE